ncbi:unnamed protein product [Calypogeia fissa]
MEEVQSAMWKLVAEVGRLINSADDVVLVTTALRQLASLVHNAKVEGQDIGGVLHVFSLRLLDCSDTEAESLASLKTLNEISPDTKSASLATLKTLDEIAGLCRQKVSKAFPETPSEEVLSRVFYNGPCYAAVAQLLLRKVAVDWLACFSLLEQTTLFDNFFIQAPPSESLSALVLGLSLNEASEDDEIDFAVGDLSASCAQSERLLDLIFISGQGVKKLALSLSSRNVRQEAGSIRRGTLATYSQYSQLAQMLSSMPDRTSLQAPTALQSPFYIQSVVSQLLGAAEENWTSRSQSGTSSPLSSNAEAPKFVGEVIGGLCRRGHSDVIASQMVPFLLQHLHTATRGWVVAENQHSRLSFEDLVEKLQMSFWPSVAASITDSHALERFSEALIKEMASKPDVTDWQACCGLHTLYGKLLKERATIRSMFTEKFLFAKILPIRCLKWVLDFAILQSPPASDQWVQPEGNGSKLQKNVVRRLAEEWAAKEFIQSASVQQQAYLTAALGICLGPMNKAAPDGIDGLVPSLLKGVSNRLDSPLIPVRNMAKRIALAFSTAMDPGNPLLFDESDSVEELRNWEGLEQQVGQKSFISNTVEKRQIAAKSELDEDHNGAISHVDDKEQKRERRRRRKAKEEKLALEEDDPDAIVKLGEGSLDDESEESSESDGDSDSELQPYEMSDEDDDVRRGKFVAQLADLAINLRKGDKPDAVEEALQVAEKFILAMPEELDNLASDLTHALVHVKCGTVSVEGEEDIAEERRQRALLALLSCSPVLTVTVLTTELFSQHVDVSQRILILDTMAAGARLLATSSEGHNASIGKNAGQLITSVSRTTDLDSWYAPGSSSGRTGAGPWVEVSSPLPGGNLVGWAHRYERELPLKPGQKLLGRSRRWGNRAMQLRKDERIQNSSQALKNRFAPLAAAFMLPVMRDYDKKKRGLDLLGRDFHVLGAVLSMLGVCVECVSMQREASILGAGLLEMLRSREISSHSETFVRRTALFAASRVLVALHPSDVGASLTAGVSSLVSNLEWVREWALDISMNDVDADCSMMATACVQLHSEMALQVQRAMNSIKPSSQSLEAKIYTRPAIIMPY